MDELLVSNIRLIVVSTWLHSILVTWRVGSLPQISTNSVVCDDCDDV